MDPAHPFPFVSNLSLNILVKLHYRKDKETSLARIKVPVGGGHSPLYPRWTAGHLRPARRGNQP